MIYHSNILTTNAGKARKISISPSNMYHRYIQIYFIALRAIFWCNGQSHYCIIGKVIFHVHVQWIVLVRVRLLPKIFSESYCVCYCMSFIIWCCRNCVLLSDIIHLIAPSGACFVYKMLLCTNLFCFVPIYFVLFS